MMSVQKTADNEWSVMNGSEASCKCSTEFAAWMVMNALAQRWHHVVSPNIEHARAVKEKS